MQGLSFGEKYTWSLGTPFGLDYSFLAIDATTIVHTWIIIFLTIVGLCAINYFFKRNARIQYLTVSVIQGFMNLLVQSLGFFSFEHFCFIFALFLFILLCNIAAVIPGIEEPTQNLNTTLILGIISFVYVQCSAIKTNGLWPYIKNEYFSPFFLMLPLHIIGKLASIISIAFRLFGNIFGGVIISHIYFGTLESLHYSWLFQLLGLISGFNFIIIGFFTLFEGALQALVFTMLSLTYLSIAIHNEEQP